MRAKMGWNKVLATTTEVRAEAAAGFNVIFHEVFLVYKFNLLSLSFKDTLRDIFVAAAQRCDIYQLKLSNFSPILIHCFINTERKM